MDIKLLEIAKSSKRLDLKNDYVFKKIFSKPENNLELKGFLEAILNIKIDKIEVKNPELPKNYKKEKLGILDIRAHVNDNIIIDIEMQTSNNYTVDKNLRYSTKMMSEQLKVGEKYRTLKKVISIIILGENILKGIHILIELL